MTSSVALITGASSGIGYQAALALQAKGATVYAAARRAIPTLAERGIHTLTLDLADEGSLASAVERILDREGHIDILVNNAGYGAYGAIEEVSIAEARHQFEVNVFGAMRLTQLVLPSMIARGHGRIVNMSSLGGRFAMALGGWYHATKYALEALTDALRQEVKPFGVDVVLIEPGLVHTDWPRIAASSLKATSGFGRYAHIAENFALALDFAGRIATEPNVIGALVAHAATTARPRTRYRKGFGAVPLAFIPQHLPDRAFDWAVKLLLNHFGDLVNLVRSDIDELV
ncbi:MAG: SDR family NAD(P)-dependent oxidoreductase [Propionibacteriaceae bacterium]|jgi:NAD(P)-dependent dehydrogenase (short-subunit alcohol dehydrogenase family)|nr:SDR family NAD(P)-dependent oxidoreductase [Propionibacteriaceae bacterium]